MDKYHAVDAGTRSNGKIVFNVGISLQVKDGREFDKHYFDIMGDFCKKYDIDIDHKVLKAKSLNMRVPSFELREAHGELVNSLVATDALDSIGLVIGYLDDLNDFKEIKYFNKKYTPNSFTGRVWSQYFNITTLWKLDDIIVSDYKHALMDSVQGKITKNWTYVGHEYDITLVPNGDTTYPAISTADLITNLIGKILCRSTDIENYTKIGFGVLKKNTKAFIATALVNNAEKDQFISTYPYAIEGLQHAPHPIIYIHDKDFKKEEIEEFEFFNVAKKWAFENNGCVINLDFRRVAPILQKNDIIVSDGPDPKIQKYCKMNKQKSLKVIDIEGIYEL